MALPQASLNWITFSEEDIKDAREVLRNLYGESTVDSLGLGLPVETISDILFPGTSTLHRDVRYMIFLVASFYKMYKEAREGPIKDPRYRLEKLELELQKILLETEKKAIGSRAKDKLKAWPRITYWGAINKLKLFGDKKVSRAELYENILELSKPRLVDDDGNPEEFDYLIDLNSEMIEIMINIFDGKQFKSIVDFKLTNLEAKFLKKKIESIKYGKESLLHYFLINSPDEIEKIQSFMSIKKTEIPMLDELIKQSRIYSQLSQGIQQAYQFALCDHRANVIYKDDKVKKQEWLEGADKNITNLQEWMKNKESLQAWDLRSLEFALNAYEEKNVVDDHLRRLFKTFQDCWKTQKTAKKIAHAFASECQYQEEIRRKNKNHFKNPAISLPENTTGDSYGRDFLYDYRFDRGWSNALDISKGLLRRKS